MAPRILSKEALVTASALAAREMLVDRHHEPVPKDSEHRVFLTKVQRVVGIGEHRNRDERPFLSPVGWTTGAEPGSACGS